MGQIKVTKCPIEGLYIIEPAVHGDNRGYFMETYNQKDMEEAGLTMNFVQDNQSCSTKGVLRGLHYQKQFPQGKLVRVIKGKVFDVAVDLRTHSETYGKWYGVELKTVLHSRRLCPRLPGTQRHSRILLQMHRLLPSRRRRRHGLERSGDRRRMAGSNRRIQRNPLRRRLLPERRHPSEPKRKRPEMGRI